MILLNILEYYFTDRCMLQIIYNTYQVSNLANLQLLSSLQRVACDRWYFSVNITRSGNKFAQVSDNLICVVPLNADQPGAQQHSNYTCKHSRDSG